METPKIKNIIFDLGNTLIFFDHGYFYDGLANIEKGLNANKLKKFIIEKKLDVKLGKGRITGKDFFKAVKKKFNIKTGYNDFIYLYSDVFWENKPMIKLLENLIDERRYKVFLLSNTDSSHFNFILKNFPSINLIKNKILSYKVNALKPEKKIFTDMVKRYRINPQETVFIDDIKPYIVSADKLKFNTIHYTTHKNFLKQFNKLIK
ncbi:MAG: HAD-IA family hydrolase [Bacteroidetes bacterium]|nr:HAD-IA family hydrolase [Bacteroidota bacterium]